MTARPVLELRARTRSSLRRVFEDRGFLEVDTPVLSQEVLPEPHIDPLVVDDPRGGRRYLQASPEALMKRLLAAGSGAIYQFARSFRSGERGDWHDEEFVLLEWYEPAATLTETAGLLDELCAATLGTRGLERIGCGAAFGLHAGVDPLRADAAALEAALDRAGVRPPAGHDSLPAAERWDRAFELLLALVVQPRLGRGRPTMLEDWPPSQAAFARIAAGVARRFELFAEGVELANGWEEDPRREPLVERITAANRSRQADGRDILPVPERLLAAHGATMPEGVGAALGFDRLVVLAGRGAGLAAARWFPSDAV